MVSYFGLVLCVFGGLNVSFILPLRCFITFAVLGGFLYKKLAILGTTTHVRMHSFETGVALFFPNS